MVELGTATVTVAELLELAVNDVLQLETRVDGDISILVGQRVKFLCKPGLSGNKTAVQIVKVLDEGDDDSNE